MENHKAETNQKTFDENKLRVIVREAILKETRKDSALHRAVANKVGR